MAFESHLVALLDVEDDAVPIVEGRLNRFPAGFRSQLQEFVSVELIEPGQTLLHLVRVYPATQDVLHIRRLAPQDGRTGEIPEFGFTRDINDVFLPICGQQGGYVECRPREDRRHSKVVLAKEGW